MTVVKTYYFDKKDWVEVVNHASYLRNRKADPERVDEIWDLWYKGGLVPQQTFEYLLEEYFVDDETFETKVCFDLWFSNKLRDALCG